jgi:hypothetical protein
VALFINLRGPGYQAVGSPIVLEGDPLIAGQDPQMTVLTGDVLRARAAGRSVLLATHGFNVNYVDGLRGLARLEAMVAAGATELVIGVLWPGDFVIPAINFPFSEKVAAQAGKVLGKFCNDHLSQAASLSFVSHSLGVRVVLEAAEALKRRPRDICIAAGAIGADCLTAEYAAAASNSDALVTLSSMADQVLALAFPPGDLIADILNLDHKPFQRALGRRGPQTPYGPPVTAAQIPDALGYNHGDYMPPADLTKPVPDPDPHARWPSATAFMARAFRGSPQSWPR